MRKIWTAEDRSLLVELYPHKSTREIAQRLNRSEKSIYSQANLMQLSKSSEYMTQELARQAERLKIVGAGNRFSKGSVPSNKGKKQIAYMSVEAIERTKATRFKKGNVPQNKKEIGHQRITKDGYVEVKVAEPNRFVLLHRWIWKIWNGPIPKGHIIIFKDGNKQNCAIENLEIITMKENVLRNSIERYPPELKKIMRLQGKLKRVINQKTNQNGKK
jgi:hypothetical protein